MKRTTAAVVAAQQEKVEKTVSEKLDARVGDIMGRFEEVSAVEPRLRKLIVETEEKYVRLRQEINPHEIAKSIKTKAEVTVLEQQRLELERIKGEFTALRTDSDQKLAALKRTVKGLVPLVNELYDASGDSIAARQSNCLVCGRKGSRSPRTDLKGRVETETQESFMELVRMQGRVGRNQGLNATSTGDGRPRTANSRSFLQNQRHQTAATGESMRGGEETTFVRKGKMATKKRCKLPLSYQMMNERFKESIGTGGFKYVPS